MTSSSPRGGGDSCTLSGCALGKEHKLAAD